MPKQPNKLAQKFVEIMKGRKLYPPLNNYSVFIQGSAYNTKRFSGPWYDHKYSMDLCLLIREGKSQVRLPEDDLIHAAQFVFHEYMSQPETYAKRTEFFYKNIAKMDSEYVGYTYANLAKLDWPSLLKIASDARATIWESNGAVQYSIIFDKDACWANLTREKLAVTRETFDAMWERGTEAAFKSFDKAQLFDFLEQIIARRPWSEIVEHCQYFLTDYYSAKDLVAVEKALRDRYAQYIDNPELAKKALADETRHLEDMQASHKEWLSTLDPEARRLGDFLQQIMRIRDNRKNFFAKGLTVIWRIAERMFDEVGVDKKLIVYYTMMELFEGVDKLRVVTPILAERAKGFTILLPYDAPCETELAPVDDSMDFLDETFVKNHSSSTSAKEIRGQIGCRGLVKGTVRVVLNANSAGDFHEGDVLVAGMTRPEYVALMKKAAAIITDEGGITCHAAIVSRELNKPCVIGTKIATQILKDGDVVEVDANNGVVRVL